MNAKQRSLYFRTWGKVRKGLIELGGMTPAEADEQRKEIHYAALGSYKSSKDFKNRDLDMVLDHFHEALKNMGALADERKEDHPRKRLIYAIRKLGLDDAYLNSLSRDAYKAEPWHELPLDQLTKLRFTATNRSRKKNKAS